MIGLILVLLLSLLLSHNLNLLLMLIGLLRQQGILLSLEVPDLNAVLRSDSHPGGLRVESQGSHDRSGIELVDWLAAVVEVPDLDLFVLTAGDDEGALGGGRDGVDVAVVSLEAVLDVERLVVPDLETAVPASRCEEGVGEVALGGAPAQEPHVRDPVSVVVGA